ncbi:MAG: hypothetical protein ACRDRJ_37325, partial [Streptosporangiaceae bacterium]
IRIRAREAAGDEPRADRATAPDGASPRADGRAPHSPNSPNSPADRPEPPLAYAYDAPPCEDCGESEDSYLHAVCCLGEDPAA